MAASLLDSLNSELATVRRIQKSCGGDVDEELANAQRRGDKFLMLKARLASELGKLAENLEERNRNVGTRKKKIKRDNEIRKSKITLQNGLKELWEMLAHERSRGKRSKVKDLPKREAKLKDFEKRVHMAIRMADGRDGDSDDDGAAFGAELMLDENGEIVDAGTGTPRLAEAAMPEEEITEGQQRQLDMITRNTAQQDQLVDKIGAGVGRLKEYALAIGEELDIQDRQLDDIHKDVDKTQKHLDRVNERANKALKMVNSKTEKCCWYIICLIILLGVLTVVYNLIV